VALEAGSVAGRSAAAHSTSAEATSSDARWPALDGMRAVAILAVLMYHLGLLPGGYLGVDVFFVLSGFLITSLLLREWDGRGRISFRDFYARRVLRLFPALSCLLVASVVFAGLLYLADGTGDRSYARATLGAIPWVVGFAGNWIRALGPSGAASALGALGHTWSLAVEEQFYLVWPALFGALMRRCPRRSAVALSLAILAIADMIYRGELAHLGLGYDRIYYGADTHCDGLMLGCSIAFWLASGRQPVASMAVRRLIKGAAWTGAAVLFVLTAIGQQADAAVDISAAVLATVSIVVAIVVREVPLTLDRLLCSRPAVRIGQRSYGLYLWQYIMFAAAEALVAPSTGFYQGGIAPRLLFATAMTAALGATFVAAALSYRYVERPALAIKKRFQIRT
jgi:peptidoglycan/LPS O-acetylase OafA/YrhL